MKAKFNLTNMKSRCFMLVACLTLILGTIACSTEDFGTDLPEQEKTYTRYGKTYTKQELIDQALSRMPMTKAPVGTDYISMVTISDTIAFTSFSFDPLVIDWGDGQEDTLRGREFTHIYTDEFPSRRITISGSEKAFNTLILQNNGLIFLEAKASTLRYLDCNENHLDKIELYKCPGLTTLNVENNELTSIDLTNCPIFLCLRANNNRLRTIELPNSPEFLTLEIGGSRITDLDLTQHLGLTTLVLYDLPLKTINNQPISDTSFSCFSNLLDFDISGTPFTELDISANSRLRSLNIAYSDIKILTYTEESLRNLIDLHIEGTPLENINPEMHFLVKTLRNRSEPNDWGQIEPGNFYTHSQIIMQNYLDLLNILKSKNWLVNP